MFAVSSLWSGDRAERLAGAHGPALRADEGDAMATDPHEPRVRRRDARTGPIRVALVDDHQFIADLLSRALERQPERFVFVGNAPRLADVGPLLREDPADVVLVDYSLPDGRGSDVLRARAAPLAARPARAVLRPLRVGHPARGDRRRAPTGSSPRARAWTRSSPSSSGRIAARCSSRRRSCATSCRQPAAGASRLAALDRLTPRERVVLEAMLAAGTTEEAARRIGMAPGDAARPPASRRPEARRHEPPRDDQRRAPRRADSRAVRQAARLPDASLDPRARIRALSRFRRRVRRCAVARAVRSGGRP